MALIEFENLPSTNTPISAENLNFNFQEILNLVCPIGKVEVFFDNNDHSNHLGFTWERTSIGKVPVGIDSNDSDFDTIGETGGEKTHTLTEAEMPQKLIGSTNSGSSSDGYLFRGGYTTTGNINVGGLGQPHNNLQPYQVMAFWKRVS